jgi:hypothetical protein
MLNDIGINENLANNLFVDLELNKTELERMIKNNMDQKLNQIFNEKEKIEQKRPSNRGNAEIWESSEPPIFNKENKLAEIEQSKISNFQENNNNNINQINSGSSTTTQPIPTHNLSLLRYTELRSHFDVIRKLAYLPNINSLVSVSEVRNKYREFFLHISFSIFLKNFQHFIVISNIINIGLLSKNLVS